MQGEGTGKAHAYIVFFDVDSVWRTMDIWPALEDNPRGRGGSAGAQPAPLTGDYPIMKYDKLLVDKPPHE